MPPHVLSKRLRSPAAQQSSTPRDKRKKTAVFDALDQRDPVPSSEAKKKYLEALGGSDDSDDSSSSQDEAPSSKRKAPSLPATVAAKRRRVDPQPTQDKSESEDSSSEEEDEEAPEEDWSTFVQHHQKRQDNESDGEANNADKNIEITLGDGNDQEEYSTITSSLNAKKRGPSKRDRQIRNSAHALHVQSLLYHNYVRNHWVSRSDLHEVLKQSLSDSCKDEVLRWRNACDRMLGKESAEESPKSQATSKQPKSAKRNDKKGKSGRDWGSKAAAIEDDLSSGSTHSDPTLRLLKTLSSFWKKRFRTAAPGLRKQGWKSVPRLGKELKAFQNNMQDFATYGERIESYQAFKTAAGQAEGSRDLGAQLFTGMLRAVGIEARLVCNLQVIGFGWSKGEEADPPKKKDELASPGKPSKAVRPAKKTPARSIKSATSGTKDLPISLTDDDDSPLSTPPESDSDESLVDVTHLKQIPTVKKYDRDLPFPIYWTEVLSPFTNTWIPVDPLVLSIIANSPAQHYVFEPRGAGADRAKQIHGYVVAYNSNGSVKDVTTRYMKNHMWPGKTKGVRVAIEKVPVYNKHGKVRKYEEYDWFKHVLSMYALPGLKRTTADDIEDTRDLKPVHPQRDGSKTAGEETLQGYKNSAEFVLERHLRREEAVKPGCSQVKTFRTGKGDAAKDEPVYLRADVVRCKTVESWHKEGREVRDGEPPLKRVPMRAVTTMRKREIEATERETGEKAMQGLYSQEQTQWIIPPPIEGGIIPKNAFGNIDVYVPTMVPQGAVHLPLRGTPKICRRLDVDFAEACTGFEFGNRMAVPVLTGVVIAAENRKKVVEAWRTEQEVIKKKEQEKRDKLVFGTWKKMLAGLRVIERVRRDYGEDAEMHLEQEMKSELSRANKGKKAGTASGGRKRKPAAAPAVNHQAPTEAQDTETIDMSAVDLGGGFIPEGQSVEILDAKPRPPSPTAPAAGKYEDDMAGGFILEDDDADKQASAPITPIAQGSGMQSLRQRMAAAEAGEDEDNDVKQITSNGVHDPEQGDDEEMDLDIDASFSRPRTKVTHKGSTLVRNNGPNRSRESRTRKSANVGSTVDDTAGSDSEADENKPSGASSKYFAAANPTTHSRREAAATDEEDEAEANPSSSVEEEDAEEDGDFGARSAKPTRGRGRGQKAGRGGLSSTGSRRRSTRR